MQAKYPRHLILLARPASSHATYVLLKEDARQAGRTLNRHVSNDRLEVGAGELSLVLNELKQAGFNIVVADYVRGVHEAVWVVARLGVGVGVA